MSWRDDSRNISEEELSAFADGQLPQKRCAQVANYLRANPAEAERIYAYWKHDAVLYAAFKPESEQETKFQAGRGNYFPLYAGAVAALIFFTVLVPRLWEKGAVQLFVPTDKSLAAEIGVETPLTTYAALELVEPPGQGFALGRAAEFHFTGSNGVSLVLYETPMGSGDAEYALGQGGVNRVEWIAGDKHYALVGGQDAAQLIAMATLLRESMAAPAVAPAPSVSAVARPPVADPALQPPQDEILPAGVSRM
jgi:hypothetical protein